MTKRFSRTSVALAAAALLASPFVAQTVADAQTITSPQINLSAKANGPVTSGVTGTTITVSCKGLLGAAATATQPYTAAFGAVPVPTYWPLTPAVATYSPNGSSCIYTAALAGINTTVGVPSIAIAVGGIVRATGTGTVATGDIPTFISTDVVVTVTFPSITVKKVVNGDEPVAGYAYPMALNCSNVVQNGAVFIDVNGNLDVGGADAFLTVVGARVYDYRTVTTPVTAPAGSYVGTKANIAIQAATNQNAAGITAAAIAYNAALPASSFTSVTIPPVGTVNGVVVFNGTFALTGTGTTSTRTFGVNELPGLTGKSVCEVVETGSQNAALSYSSTVVSATGIAGTPLAGVLVGTPAVFKSALTAMGQTVTVTNSFLGNLVISKVVTGDPKTNIATYEISVACDKGGPKDTFLLKDRQSKVYSNLVSGTNCLVTETRSDGAVASYSDNSGDNTTDGRVTIKRAASCGSASTVGAPTVALPGGPTIPVTVTTADNCDASVIITNNYNVVDTTTTTAAAAPTTVAPATTAAPAVTPAPATPVEATPTFTG